MMSPADLYRHRVWWAVRPLQAWRLARLGVRAAWLAGALTLLGALAFAIFGRPLSFAQWVLVGGILFLPLFAVLALWPLRLPPLLRRLDLALGAHDQLSTAREVAERGPQNYVEARLLRNAEALLNDARPRFERTPRAALIPWADLEMVLLVMVVGYAVWLNLGALRPSVPRPDYVPLPTLGAEPAISLPGLPPELNAGQQPFTPSEETQSGNLNVSSATAQQALDQLARALNESAATQPVASALAQGNAAQAAAELRRLAESARSFSAESRARLAEQLQALAEQLGAIAPEVADQLAQAAEGLSNPDPTRAAEALAALARLIEDLEAAQSADTTATSGQTAESNNPSAGTGAGSTAGREAQPGSPTDRLGSEGEVVQLPEGEIPSAEAGTLQGPSQSNDPATGEASANVSGVGSGGAGGAPAFDPLSYPWRWRYVVEGYFSTH